MTLHPMGPREAKDKMLNVIQKAGADCNKVIFGHLDHYSDQDDLLNLLKAGCYIELDVFGWEDTSLELIMPSAKFGNDQERIENIGQIIEISHIGGYILPYLKNDKTKIFLNKKNNIENINLDYPKIWFQIEQINYATRSCFTENNQFLYQNMQCGKNIKNREGRDMYVTSQT